MRKTLCILALIALSCTPAALHAQTPVPACPAAATIDELIKDLDTVIGGTPDKDRSCMNELLLPGARLIPMAKGPDGKLEPRVLTLDAWLERIKAHGKEPFYEHQVKYSVDLYGQIAHIWSTYEIRPTPDGKAMVRGINSIQAVYDGAHWKIQEILWQAEDTNTPIPPKYLP